MVRVIAKVGLQFFLFVAKSEVKVFEWVYFVMFLIDFTASYYVSSQNNMKCKAIL